MNELGLTLVCPMPPSKNEAFGVGAERRLKSKVLRQYERTFAAETTRMSPHLWTWQPPEGKVLWSVESTFFFERLMTLKDHTEPLILDVHNREIWLYDCLSTLIGIPDQYFFRKSVEKRERVGTPVVEVTLSRYRV